MIQSLGFDLERLIFSNTSPTLCNMFYAMCLPFLPVLKEITIECSYKPDENEAQSISSRIKLVEAISKNRSIREITTAMHPTGKQVPLDRAEIIKLLKNKPRGARINNRNRPLKVADFLSIQRETGF